MLIKCPRCGFSQPKDRYCAQCGIDMEIYKPKSESFSTKLFRSPLTHAVLLAALAAVVASTIVKRNHSNHESSTIQPQRAYEKNVVQINSGSDEASSTTAPSEAPQTEAGPPNDLNTAADPMTLPPEEPAPTVTAVATSASNKITEDLNRSAGAIKNPSTTGVKVSIYYTLINMQVLGRIFEESQNNGSFASFSDYSAGLWVDAERRMNSLGTAIKILDKSDKTVDDLKTLSWQIGSRSNEGTLYGFTTRLEPREIERGTFKGSLLIQRNWSEKNSYPNEIEITPASGFFISGLLPHTWPDGLNPQQANVLPFTVLKDPGFSSRNFEFVMIIVVHK